MPLSPPRSIMKHLCTDTSQHWGGISDALGGFLQKRTSITLGKALSRGCNATVYAAEKNTNGLEVVVKAFQGSAHRDFSAELRALKLLGDHPNIVQLMEHHVEETTNISFIFMAPLGQFDLHTLMCSVDSPGKCDEVHSVILGSMHGLMHVHDRGLVHRDVKPENVVCVKGFSPPSFLDGILIDFNLTCNEGMMVSPAGTLIYSAPEVLASIKSRSRLRALKTQDSWSMGKIFEVAVKTRCDSELDASVRAGFMTRDPGDRLTVGEALEIVSR